MVAVYCGIDWAEGHHDIALVDDGGKLLGKRRIQESVEGFAELGVMLAAAGDSADEPIPVAIETPRGDGVGQPPLCGEPSCLFGHLGLGAPRDVVSASAMPTRSTTPHQIRRPTGRPIRLPPRGACSCLRRRRVHETPDRRHRDPPRPSQLDRGQPV